MISKVSSGSLTKFDQVFSELWSVCSPNCMKVNLLPLLDHRWVMTLELRFVCPSIHKKFFRFPSNLVCG